MTLSAFADERRAAGLLLCAGVRRCRLIYPAGGRSAANPPHAAAAVKRRDRQTNGRTLDRYIDPAPPIMRAVSIREDLPA